MVESFADELAGGEQNTRRIGWQRIEFCDERGALFPGHPSVKNETWRGLCTQRHLDGVEVLGALGQDQHLSALIERILISAAITAVRARSFARSRNTS